MLEDLRQYISPQKYKLCDEAILLNIALEYSSNEALTNEWIKSITDNVFDDIDLGLSDIFVEKLHLQDWISPDTFQSGNPFQDLLISACCNNYQITTDYFELSYLQRINSSGWPSTLPLKIRKTITRDTSRYIVEALDKEMGNKICRTFYGSNNRKRDTLAELENSLSELDTIFMGYSYVTTDTSIDKLMNEIGYTCLGNNRYYQSWMIYSECYDGYMIDCDARSVLEALETEISVNQKKRNIDIDRSLANAFDNLSYDLIHSIMNIKENRTDVIM